MASPVGTLRVDLAANTAQFAAGMDAARAKIAQFQQAGVKASAATGALGTEFSRMGRSIAGNRFALQNAAYQVGDFATQVAAGTSATRAMAMQLPQLLGGFGPLGTAVATALAIFSVFAVKMSDGAAAASKFRSALDSFNPSISGVLSGIEELRNLQEKYVAAVAAAGGASSGAAALVVANTQREIAVKKRLLELEIRILQARGADRQSELSALQSQIDAKLARAQDEARVARDIFENFAGSPGKDAPPSRELPEASQPLRDFRADNEVDMLKLRGLRAELEKDKLLTDGLEESLNAVFNDPGAAGTGAGSGGGGGSGGSVRSGQAKQLTEDLRAATEQAQYFTEIQDDMKQGFLDAILEGKNFGDVIDDIAKSLARAALESALFNTGPWAAAGGGGGLLGSLFGGFRAGGGPVSGGRAYVVGERGPEIIVPRMSGAVIPNDQVLPAAGRDVTVTIAASDDLRVVAAHAGEGAAVRVVKMERERFRRQ